MDVGDGHHLVRPARLDEFGEPAGDPVDAADHIPAEVQLVAGGELGVGETAGQRPLDGLERTRVAGEVVEHGEPFRRGQRLPVLVVIPDPDPGGQERQRPVALLGRGEQRAIAAQRAGGHLRILVDAEEGVTEPGACRQLGAADAGTEQEHRRQRHAGR